LTLKAGWTHLESFAVETLRSARAARFTLRRRAISKGNCSCAFAPFSFPMRLDAVFFTKNSFMV
jgi:hypothetical protein